MHKGLDLVGGAQLEYSIDLTEVAPEDHLEIVSGIKNVIDNRVNGMGLVEPNVYTAKVGENFHVFVELPEIEDLNEAIALVGKTVSLQFKEEKLAYSAEELQEIQAINQRIENKATEALASLDSGSSFDDIQAQYSSLPVSESQQVFFQSDNPSAAEVLDVLQPGSYTDLVSSPSEIVIYKLISSEVSQRPVLSSEMNSDGGESEAVMKEEQLYTVDRIVFPLKPNYPQGGFAETELTGKYFRHADVVLDNIGKPIVQISFDEVGAQLFAEITERNINRPVAIYLDGEMISSPTVQAVISDGVAVITGRFDLTEAKELAMQMNTGAIPAPVKLVSQQKIGASLGNDSWERGILAGFLGFILLCVYMIWYYRFSGLLASLALTLYALIVYAIFKIFGLTISLAGIAGFILSIGMAVDANILIFERIKEELREGRSMKESLEIGFSRAWSSIRDSNSSSLITCAILFIFASGMIRGFAVTLAIGIVVSIFTAVTLTRNLLYLWIASVGAKGGDMFIGKINK
ncbi:MAG: protein translocase subunit SecD [Patescibacteria group bacterium]|nr:protein translocase subunit SecD [Patescibacteria group bacterium]